MNVIETNGLSKAFGSKMAVDQFDMHVGPVSSTHLDVYKRQVYAQRLADDGGDVQCYRMLDAVHGYLLYPSVFNIVRDTYRIVKQFLDGDPLVQEGEPTWLGLLGTD